VGLLLVLAGGGYAQTPSGPSSYYTQPIVRPNLQLPAFRSPVVSPYLNLVNPGGLPAINYYGIVRPELQFSGEQQQLRQQLSRLEGDIQEPDRQRLQNAADAAAGGQPRYFFNYSHYYPTLGRR
jgi:hypothetical protein